MLDILAENQFATVRDIADQLNASEATIRRDINKLANNGLLHKIRGGAESVAGRPKVTRPLAGSNFLADRQRQSGSKRQIARRAAELCKDGDSITINGGSSTFMMGEFLTEHRLSILTNSFELAHFLVENSDNQVSVPGGVIYRKQSVILSAFENDGIEYYHSSKMFMGTPGIGDFGVMEADPLLIRQEQKLKRQAQQLVVLADSTKLGNRSNFVFCPLDEVDILITDSEADQKYLDLFREREIEVIVVEKGDEP